MNNKNTSHPAGLYVLFATEMWERFSYYGMRALFILFLTKALLMDKELASQLYGSYTGLVYLTPILGGYIADRYWGNRKSIIIGGIIMAIGQFLLFASGSMLGNLDSAKWMMYVGLVFLIFGNGFFKPNISTMVGQLYPAGDKRLDSAFTIFYMGINLGAFIAPLVCGFFGERYNEAGEIIPDYFKWGFLVAGIGMLLSVALFIYRKDKYIVTSDGQPVGMPKKADTTSKEETPNFKPAQIGIWTVILGGVVLLSKFVFGFDWVFSSIVAAAIAIPGLIITDSSLNEVEKKRISVIFILAFFVIFFWSAFEQAGASLTYFAEEQTDRLLFGWTMPASWFQSVNPLAIFIFAPVFSILWIKMGKREPSSPMKMAIGLALVALGYLVIAMGVKAASAGVKTSMVILVVMYLIHTFGELCLSPIGLSMVSKLAPLRFSSLLMGTWFVANALANKLAGSLSALYPPGQGEVNKAAKEGIDLNAILNGSIKATNEQLEKLKSLEISSSYKSILGYQITNLYDFFMLFVVYAGVAALLLIVIQRVLVKWMHGVK